MSSAICYCLNVKFLNHLPSIKTFKAVISAELAIVNVGSQISSSVNGCSTKDAPSVVLSVTKIPSS